MASDQKNVRDVLEDLVMSAKGNPWAWSLEDAEEALAAFTRLEHSLAALREAVGKVAPWLMAHLALADGDAVLFERNGVEVTTIHVRALLAAHDGAPAAPIPMLLQCPRCGSQHVDRGEWATRSHKTHRCESCAAEWRPAQVATVGVESLEGCSLPVPAALMLEEMEAEWESFHAEDEEGSHAFLKRLQARLAQKGAGRG